MSSSIFNEVDLLARLAKNDEQAFTAIYHHYYELLYKSACQRLDDADQAQDIVQEVFIKLWEQRGSSTIGNLKAYLQSSVRNRIYNLVVHDKVRDSYFEYLQRLDLRSGAADDNIRFKELNLKYQELLNQMPERQRQVFKLRYEEDLSTHHIAEKMNISQKTVQNQLIKAVNYLKAIITSLLFFLLW